MKRIVLISLCLIVLLTPVMGYSSSLTGGDILSYDNNLPSLQLAQEEAPADNFTPFIYDVLWANNTPITPFRARNSSLGEGAIYKVDPYDAIKFRYAVALNNFTEFDVETYNHQLRADLPVVNGTAFNNTASNQEMTLGGQNSLNFTFLPGLNQTNQLDFTYPFDLSTTLPNATIYIFESFFTLNVSVSYIPFFVRDEGHAVSERDNNRPYNLISTGQTFNTSTTDEFYIQDEIANITATVTGFDNNAEFAIAHRTNSSSYEFTNYTLIPDGADYNGTMSFGPYNPGTTLDWYTLYYVNNDTLINQSRIITRIDIKNTSFGDGNPVLEGKIFSDDTRVLIRGDTIFTRNSTIQFNATVSVPKGEVLNVTLTPADGESPIPFPDVNGTVQDLELSLNYNYSMIAQDPDFGDFNATVLAFTDKGLNVSESFRIVFDRISPVGELSIPAANNANELTTKDGRVTFSFSFSDDESGVLRAILDFGDQSSAEVTNINEYTHKYDSFDNQGYTLRLTVIDHAGNEFVTFNSISLKAPDIGPTSPKAIGIPIFIVFAVALAFSPMWVPPVFEYLRNKFF